MAKNMIEKLESFLKTDPNDTFTKFALALEYLKQEDLAKALNLFEDILSSDPDYIGTYYHLGKLYQRMDRTGEAVQTYQQGVDKARKAQDMHALSELQAALMELESDDF